MTEASPVDRLFRERYGDLRRLARNRLRSVSHLTSLDATTLLHECYLKLQRAIGTVDEGRCTLPYIASAMRTIVVDHIRRRTMERQNITSSEFDEQALNGDSGFAQAAADVLRVDEALDVLQKLDLRLGSVVEMKFYGGFSEAEIASALGIDERSVRRDWSKARVMLRTMLKAP